MADIGTTTPLRTASRRAEERRWFAGLVGSLAMVLAVALASALLTAPAMVPQAALDGRSYFGWLVKPSWALPARLFAPVWSALFVAVAVAAWLVWRARSGRGAVGVWSRARRRGLVLYALQLVLTVAWSALFFYVRRPGWGLVSLLALDLVTLLTISQFWRVRRLAGLLQVPFLVWVSYATILNAAIAYLNR